MMAPISRLTYILGSVLFGVVYGILRTAIVVVVFGVEQGILLAIVLSVIDHLRRSYRPRDTVLVRDEGAEIRSVPVESGTDAITRQARCVVSNSVIARVPLSPCETCRQNSSRPTPNGDTTPIPVIATRGCGMVFL